MHKSHPHDHQAALLFCAASGTKRIKHIPHCEGGLTMGRAEIRILKRAVAFGGSIHASELENGQARESALQLLARSIKFGHRRLALIRLGEAVRTGATVTPEQWIYCEEVVSGSVDVALREMLAAAKRNGNQSGCS